MLIRVPNGLRASAFAAALFIPVTGFTQDSCIELGALAWDSWWKVDAGGPGSLPAGVESGDYVRCKACHGWDRLGTEGGYVRRSRTESRPNAGFGDGDQTSRVVSTVMGGPDEITGAMIMHEGTGRSYADGGGSFVLLDEGHSASNKAAHSRGFTLGNQHPDFSMNGVNSGDLVLSQEQVDCLAAFMNSEDADPSAYFSGIFPSVSPVLYTIAEPADAAAGEAFYVANCESCHGAPESEDPPVGAPEGGMLGYLAEDGKFSEFAHKVRWGIPDEMMTREVVGSPSAEDVRNVMKYLQEEGNTGFRITTGISGSWYDPAHDGEGFLLDVAGRHGKHGLQMVATYYTYDGAGRQTWMIGSGTVHENSVSMDLVVTDGATFGSGFNPDDVNRTAWGTLELTFSSCKDGMVKATPDASQTGFEAISYPIVRLTPVGHCP